MRVKREDNTLPNPLHIFCLSSYGSLKLLSEPAVCFETSEWACWISLDVVAIRLLLWWISLVVNEYNFLFEHIEARADGCKLIFLGILIRLQDSNSTWTGDLIPYVEHMSERPQQPLNRCNTGCKTSGWLTWMMCLWIINWFTCGAFTYQTANRGLI